MKYVPHCEHRDAGGRGCVLIAGHGPVPLHFIRGDIIDGHLYSRGDDLSAEIRAQTSLDYIAALEVRIQEIAAERDAAETQLAAALGVNSRG